MNTPPTEADKRAAEQIDNLVHTWEHDACSDHVAQIIANAHQPEREALRLAKEAISAHLDKDLEFDDFYKKHKRGHWSIDGYLKEALTAIEKATK